MTSFWLAASAMVVVALVLILPSMLGRLPRNRFTRQQANVAIYRERLAELNDEHSAGTIADAEYKEAKNELSRAMLDDVGVEESRETLRGSPSPWGGIIIAVATPLIAFGLYLQLGTPLSLQESKAPVGAQHEGTTLEALVEQLEGRLATNPEDSDGWWMLARTYAAMERLEDARGAYDKAYKRLGTNPDLLVGYAEVLARLNGNRFEGRPYQLLRTAREMEPKSERALWLFGIAEYQQNGASEAIATWEQLRALGTLGPDETKLLDQFIAKARANVDPRPATQPRSAGGVEVTARTGKLTVRVAISESIAGRAAANDTVFVFARADEGPRMPIAIVKTQVRDLPATLVLDDGDAMNSEFKLSNYSTVVVEARVSKSGNATRRQGDLEGRSQPIQPGLNDPIQVVIRDVVP